MRRIKISERRNYIYLLFGKAAELRGTQRSDMIRGSTAIDSIYC